MIIISKDGDLVTLIDVFSCEPETQQALIDAWIRATDETLGKLPGIVSAALHRSTDGTRVVNYAQWKNAEAWDNLVQLVKTNCFKEMGKFAKPDAHLYEVCYVLDRTSESP